MLIHPCSKKKVSLRVHIIENLSSFLCCHFCSTSYVTANLNAIFVSSMCQCFPLFIDLICLLSCIYNHYFIHATTLRITIHIIYWPKLPTISLFIQRTKLWLVQYLSPSFSTVAVLRSAFVYHQSYFSSLCLIQMSSPNEAILS